MRNLRTWLAATCLCLFTMSAMAQVGQKFWFAAPEMALHSSDMTLRLCVFADTLDADVLVQMPASKDYPQQTFHIAAGEHYEYILAESYTQYMQQMAAKHNQITPRGLSIRATAPITCYVQFTGVNGEIYTLKGENALGNDFCLAMQNHFNNSNTPSHRDMYKEAYSSAQIVATEDSTVVNIYPSQLLYGDDVIKTRHIVLNHGEVYSFRANSKSADGHLTATRITSSKPIVVNSMDDSMSPYTKFPGEDAVAEQLVPTSLLSNEYIAMGNGLKWEGVCVIDPATGATEFIPMNGRGALYIKRDHPVQVFQVTGAGNEAGGTLLPRLYQSGSHRIQYTRPGDSKWTWIKILTPSTNTSAIQINGESVSSSLFHLVDGASQWSYASVDMATLPPSQTISVTSTGDIMHVAITDVSSNAQNKEGHYVPTSSSMVYFSSYAPEEDFVPIPMMPLIDTVYLVDTVQIERTTIIKDTVFVTVHDTVTLHQQDSVQKPGIHHRLGFYLQGAYSHIPFGDQSFKWGLGYGLGLGFFYEYQHRHFLLDVGIGALWQDAEHRSTVDELELQRSDRARTAYVEAPVLIGGMWGNFYLLGGVKIGVPIYGNTRSELRKTSEVNQTSETYTTREGRLHYMLDTRASLELGAHFGRCRLGVFADYGVWWSKLDNGTTPWMMVKDPDDMSTWEVHHPLHSSLANNRLANNFFAGIKFTVLMTSVEK